MGNALDQVNHKLGCSLGHIGHILIGISKQLVEDLAQIFQLKILPNLFAMIKECRRKPMACIERAGSTIKEIPQAVKLVRTILSQLHEAWTNLVICARPPVPTPTEYQD